MSNKDFITFSNPDLGERILEGVSVHNGYAKDDVEYEEAPISEQLSKLVCDALDLSGGKVIVFKKRSIGFSSARPIVKVEKP
jgi:hypothetical protein